MTENSNEQCDAFDYANASSTHLTLAARERWDLHCHTVYSDGTAIPEDLIMQAKLAGLHGVAITDHDTTAGWDDFRAAAKVSNMPVLFGSEITAQDAGVYVHMLAYQYNPKNAYYRNGEPQHIQANQKQKYKRSNNNKTCRV